VNTCYTNDPYMIGRKNWKFSETVARIQASVHLGRLIETATRGMASIRITSSLAYPQTSQNPLALKTSKPCYPTASNTAADGNTGILQRLLINGYP
jgi:hypothetical protein